MKYSIIAAIDSNGALGKEGKLPWKIKEDLAYFQQKTDGHIVIMGRKTFESIPKVLENRTVIILTTQEDYHVRTANHFVMHSVAEVIKFLHEKDADHVYICGGGKIYEQFIGYADFLLLTRVQHVIDEPDAVFPLVQLGNWHLMTSRPQIDFSSGYTYYFEVYTRA